MSKEAEQIYVVKRDGQPPLRFRGTILGTASTKWVGGKDQSRWDEDTIYRTKAGKIVVSHEWHTLWQGEVNSSEAWTADDIEGIIDQLSYMDGGESRIPRALQLALEDADIDYAQDID